MKLKNIYFIVVFTIVSLVLSWAIPSLVKVGTTTSQSYPFIHYSSLLQDYVIREKVNEKPTTHDTKGNNYTRNQYDSVTPLLSYRQLLLTNSMPDSILGQAVDAKLLKEKSVVWRYNPREINTPILELYSMFESMSGRANLESPDDVFRLKNNIEFITIATNSINKEKSDNFQKALVDAGFVFPAINIWGNLSPKKPYDEGYFVLDSEKQLFHLKMVNGKPFVRNTKAGNKIDIAYFTMLEVTDKSIYGFILSKSGEVYTLNTEKYSTTKFDIPNIDINSHSVILMGNLFYWMVNVTTPEGCTYNVLQAGSLKQHTAPYYVKALPDKWIETSKWLFPGYVSLSDKNSSYVKPELVINWGTAFAISFVLALAFNFTINRKESFVKRVTSFLLITLLGIPALIANLIIR